MKLLKCALAAIVLTVQGANAQSSINLHDMADVASTQLLLSTGDFVEGNTAIYGTNPTALQMIAAKVVVRAFIKDVPVLDKMGDAVSTSAAAHNIALLAGATASGAVVVGGLVGAFIIADKPPHEPPTECGYNEYLHSGRVCVSNK